MSDTFNPAETFLNEAWELLNSIEDIVLDLENRPDDTECINNLFRAMHTIKGSGAMFGFDTVSAFAHEVENVFDMVREGILKVSKHLIGLTLQAKDFIREIVEIKELSASEEEKKTNILSELKAYCDEHATLPQVPESDMPSQSDMGVDSQAVPPPVEQDQRDVTYRIRFTPSEKILIEGTDPSELIEELKTLGTHSIVAHVQKIPELDELNPDYCYIYWDILLTTRKDINLIKDIFIFLDDNSKVQIDIIDQGETDEIDYKKLGYILVDKGDLSVEEMKTVLTKQKMFGEILLESGLTDQDKIESALVEQQHVRKVRKERVEKSAASSLRVSSAKVDKLVDLVGELVTAQARLVQIGNMIDDSELVSLSEDMERLIWELRDNTMEMRMIPFGSTFGRFKRLVRDLSSSLRKQVELETIGGETELDKTVIEKLGDPLTHIIRNCIDHGIETPEERIQKGKDPVGRIELEAYHSGANVIIQITDDGAGLDTEKIEKKALEKGVISRDKKLSHKEVCALIFEPGFSTAKEVTDVSGRGVGMDVVKKNIDLLRGLIEVDSRTGMGTTIKLKIPLTLAIIDGLLVSIDTDKYVLPLSSVEECIEIKHSDVSNANGRQFVNLRGELIPYINLREMFQISTNIPELEQVVITNFDDERVGFVVDNVIGGHQTVIKSLGAVYKNIEGISGATILGDGTIALILDVLKIIQSAKLEKEPDLE